MKFLLLTLFFISFTQANDLKIYILNIGQADSQLIVFPSGYSILIDVGERGLGPTVAGNNGANISIRLEQILGKKHIDVFVLTHLHPDHAGNYANGGIWYLLEVAGFTFGKFLKRNVGTFTGSDPGTCTKKTGMKWKYAGEMNDNMAKMACYMTATTVPTKLSSIAENAKRCNNDQIRPPDAGASVTVIIRDGLGIKTSSGSKIYKNSVSKKPTVSENDFSICMRIQFGDFVYATCGDLSGYQVTSKDGKIRYHDVESKIAPMIGSVDAMKVNHHGAKTSTNSKWLKNLKPTVSVITCGGGQLPNEPPLKRLKNIKSKVFTTGNNCNQKTVSKYKNIVQMGSDVIISYTYGAKTFTVSNADGSYSTSFNVKLGKKAPSKCKLLEK